jgi:hypothetical protein
VDITAHGDGRLIITNTIQPKKVTSDTDAEAGLDNLVRRYQLLGMEITVEESKEQRKISIPLVKTEQEVEHG